MKVAFINSDLGYGSTGRIVCDLYQEVTDIGGDAIIGYGRECLAGSFKRLRIGSKLDVYLHVLITRLFDLQGFGSIRATKRFLRKLEDYKPDILHLHNLHGSYINIKLLFDYIRKSKLPVIWTLHDCWAFTGHCAYYTYVDCSRWKKQCHHCIQKSIYPASYFLDHSAKNYQRKKELFLEVDKLILTTVSEWLQREVKQSFLRGYDVRYIPNGIDRSVFKPTDSNFRKRYRLEGRKVLLGVASVWQDRKGLWLFNELAEVLEDSFRIVLVGITRKQLKHISNKILAIERTNNIGELAEIYSAADIFLNPSIEETFGMVTLEALACGTPVITNRFTANPELIDEECGIVLNRIETEAYKEAVYAFPPKKMLTENCVRKAQRFSKESCYKAYLDLYRDVV